MRFKEIIDKETSETLVVEMILRSNPYIAKQRTAIDYQLKKEFKGEAGEEERCREAVVDDYPAYFVTSNGTLVFSFHLAQSKKKKSDIAEKGENKREPEEECTF